MSIAALLQAADYLERREREAEHGYASTIPYSTNNLKNRKCAKNIKKSQGNRSTHNELEKNRRAHLRTCLEGLKSMVPLAMESSRHTTLGLLTKAKSFIKILEDRERKHASTKDQLLREQRYLRRRVEHLVNEQNLNYRVRNERSFSECSSNSVTSTGSTATSSPSPSESDEVDIMGYFSNPSDSEEAGVRVVEGSDNLCIESRLTLS